jgi:hypothetical protein
LRRKSKQQFFFFLRGDAEADVTVAVHHVSGEPRQRW